MKLKLKCELIDAIAFTILKTGPLFSRTKEDSAKNEDKQKRKTVECEAVPGIDIKRYRENVCGGCVF